VPDARIITLAILYSVGAFGIMVLNDFKAIEGDIALGIRSLPVQLGVRRSALFACAVMTIPQLVVIQRLFVGGWRIAAGIVAALVLAQFAVMPRFVRQPREMAPFYNKTGISFYVLGMMVSAVAVRSLSAGAQP
jgi:chlorophyll synthase